MLASANQCFRRVSAELNVDRQQISRYNVHNITYLSRVNIASNMRMHDDTTVVRDHPAPSPVGRALNNSRFIQHSLGPHVPRRALNKCLNLSARDGQQRGTDKTCEAELSVVP